MSVINFKQTNIHQFCPKNILRRERYDPLIIFWLFSKQYIRILSPVAKISTSIFLIDTTMFLFFIAYHIYSTNRGTRNRAISTRRWLGSNRSENEQIIEAKITVKPSVFYRIFAILQKAYQKEAT